MNKNSIIKYIKENKGATIKADTMEAMEFEKGFTVSLANKEYITQNYDIAYNKIEEYKKFIIDNNLKGVYIGVWVDTTDNDKIYIDLSLHEENRQKAVRFAKKNRQLAIWNCKKCDSEYLSYNVKVYALYKNIYNEIKNELGEVVEKIKIDEINIKDFDNLQDIADFLGKSISSVKHNTVKDYYIYSYYLNIKELKEV